MTKPFLLTSLTPAIVATLTACSGAGTVPRDGESNQPTPSATPYNGTSTPAATQSTGSATSTNPTPGAQSGNENSIPPLQTPTTSNTSDGSGDSDTLGTATMGGNGQSSNRYQKAQVTRNGQNYSFMANGWGPAFQSQSVQWNGTSFTVQGLQGNPGPNYEPASFPAMFCGVYSDSVSQPCGLPAQITSLTSLRTGWSWNANGNGSEYDSVYDIWLGTGTTISTHSGFFMVWYRDPPGQQPAGNLTIRGITVNNVSGIWDIWTGAVNRLPIINYVRPEGQDTAAMTFDILDFLKDAQQRGLSIPGTHVLSVAVGFEMWKGPITNLQSVDFFVDAK